MIKSRTEMPPREIEIDLSGPQGNAYYLLGTASKLARQLSYEKVEIEQMLEDMESSDYDNLLEVFDKHFGQSVTLYR